MFHAFARLGCVVLLAAAGCVGCRNKGPRAPQWVQTAPSGSGFALSGQMGWMIKQPMFQSAMVKYPMAERILDTFLNQARINVSNETGRVSFFVLSSVKELALEKNLDPKALASQFVLTLSDFRDPKALARSMAEAFPQEGSLLINGREYPLHVVIDINEWHVRAMLDDKGTVWLGDLRTLAQVGRAGSLPVAVQSACTWLPGGSTFQGFVHMKPFMDEWTAARTKAGDKLGIGSLVSLPTGVEAVAFSAMPVAGHPEAYRFDLVVTGTPQGIQEAQPWMQRLAAAASSVQGGSGLPASEFLQGKEHMILRCPMTLNQIQEIVNSLKPIAGKLPGGA